MWEFLIGVRLLGRSPRQCLSFIRSLVVPMIVMISVLGLINGLSGEIQTISGEIQGSSTAIILQKNTPNLHASSLNWTILEQVRLQPQVKDVIPHRLSIATVYEPLSSRTIQIEVYGVNISHLLEFHPKMYLAVGLLASEKEVNECVIGPWLGEELNTGEFYPLNVTIQGETVLKANLTGELENAGRYSGAIVSSLEFFETLFPSHSINLSFVEVKLHRNLKPEESVKALQIALEKEGYSCDVITERGQSKISREILSDSLRIFWTFAIAAFLVVALQIHFATKWIGMRFVEEFRILRELGMTRIGLTFMLLSMALLLGNLAFGIAILIGLPLGTASLALLTLFSGTSRFYAGVQLSDLIVLFVFVNLSTFLGSFHQAWHFGMGKNRR